MSLKVRRSILLAALIKHLDASGVPGKVARHGSELIGPHEVLPDFTLAVDQLFASLWQG